MIQIKTPEIYVSEPNAIKSLGLFVKKYGKRALIVWSTTAKKVTEDAIIESLGIQKIFYQEYLFSGYPTLETAYDIAREAKESEIEIIIAVGGGRVLDTSKAAGDIAKIPVASVPTIAATCAAWAALSVIYTAEGNFDHFRHNEHSPQVVVADTVILAGAPERYLKAGIVDTLAKWYETSVGYEALKSDFSYINSVNGALLAYDFLEEHAAAVVDNARRNIIDDNTVKTIDTIIFLAGNVGSYVGEKAYSGFAHPFYHSSRIVPETRDTLHGEIVAFGLLVQAVLEKKSEEELYSIIEKFSELDVAFTLEEIGIAEKAEEKLQTIEERIYNAFPGLILLENNRGDGTIINAAYKADEYVKRFRREQNYGDSEGKRRA
ncbi:iron-containing alcohol dehydrogenase family protein [Konateibacter massiliensis]|uniref:iron-containing alcohol dehydrogenase family protein n=1 Tax=Konateibacter massiliensis TaxID=2002841 RepID=UPI000C15D239|nr:iron-containing alcohol dehydrogenase family protein [Konateibacter massiliensis]